LARVFVVFALRVLTELSIAVRRATPVFVVAVRGTIFVRGETVVVVVRGVVPTVRAETFLVVATSLMVVARSRVVAFALLRDVPELVTLVDVGTLRD
jgi:hypothetical protein